MPGCSDAGRTRWPVSVGYQGESEPNLQAADRNRHRYLIGRNKPFFGDNLGILREHIGDEYLDLVYLDPPFNSNAN